MRFRCLLIFAILVPMFASSAVRADSALQTIVDGARDGRIDVCRDSRWPAWRFAEGQAGRARLGELEKLLDGLLSGTAPNSSAGEERTRLRALRAILKALDEAKRRADWDTAFARAETSYLNWRARTAVQSGVGLPSMLMRRAVWRLAGVRVAEAKISEPVGGGINACFMAGDRAAAELAVEDYLLDALDHGRFPHDSRDGGGAATAALALPDTTRGGRYISENWKRLSGGFVPAGVLPLWRVSSGIDLDPPSSIEAFEQRFAAEWVAIHATLEGLPGPLSIGEELYRRTRPEQFGRSLLGIVSEKFGTNPGRRKAFTAIWARINAVDADNTARVKVLLQTRDWFDDERDGDGAETYGWLIVQHSDDERAFQREVLVRMERLLAKGRVRRRNYAYLWDRVAVAEERPQRYGTQYTCKDGKWVLSPTEDPKKLDARRKSMGLEPAAATLDGTCG
jgi:Family of unknown function (DUF6624)